MSETFQIAVAIVIAIGAVALYLHTRRGKSCHDDSCSECPLRSDCSQKKSPSKK